MLLRTLSRVSVLDSTRGALLRLRDIHNEPCREIASRPPESALKLAAAQFTTHNCYIAAIDVSPEKLGG